MTLQEAIDHAYEVVDKSETCEQCRKDHLQLAEWLEELKIRRESDNAVGINPKPRSGVPEKYVNRELRENLDKHMDSVSIKEKMINY